MGTTNARRRNLNSKIVEIYGTSPRSVPESGDQALFVGTSVAVRPTRLDDTARRRVDRPVRHRLLLRRYESENVRGIGAAGSERPNGNAKLARRRSTRLGRTWSVVRTGGPNAVPDDGGTHIVRDVAAERHTRTDRPSPGIGRSVEIDPEIPRERATERTRTRSGSSDG